MGREMQMVAGRGGAWRALRRVWASGVSSFAPNKANLAGHTQNPANPKSEARNPKQIRKPNDPNDRNMQNKTPASNKANVRRFWPGNGDWSEKESQFLGRVRPRVGA